MAAGPGRPVAHCDAMPELSATRRFVAAVLIVATLFTLTDADPGGAWPLPVAFSFWALSVAIGLGLASAAAAALLRRPAWLRRPRWQTLLASGVLGLLLYTPLSLGLDSAFPASPEPPEGWLDAVEATGLSGRLLAELVQAGPPYLLTWGLINLAAPWPLRQPLAAAADAPRAPSGADASMPVATDAPPAAPPAAPVAALAPALAAYAPARQTAAQALGWPRALGDEVLHVAADLHYLQVATTLGRATVLGSLSAVEQHFGDQGLRVHRSHWVAARAVRSVRRTGGGWVVVLHGGASVPVSRRRVADVRARLGVDFQRDMPDGAG